jgi:hypothetical protein
MRYMLGGYAPTAQAVVKQKLCCRLNGCICGQVAVRLPSGNAFMLRLKYL